MSKRFFRNSALYLLFLTNLLQAIKTGFNWLFYLSAALTSLVLIFDIVEAVKRGKN